MTSFRNRLTEKNPLPPRKFPADEPSMSGKGMNVARDGYEILDRADARSPYDRNAKDIAPPVHDGPNVDYTDWNY